MGKFSMKCSNPQVEEAQNLYVAGLTEVILDKLKRLMWIIYLYFCLS